MIIRFAVSAVLALSLVAASGEAQTAVELLQKGIYTQETAGNLDAAIQIYRQVVSTAGSQRAAAAQALYQIVVCMVRKGDLGGAEKELQALARDFPDQVDFWRRARALLPTGPALLPAPWGEREASQLNIKRDGAFTGERLFYYIDPAAPARPLGGLQPRPQVVSALLTTETPAHFPPQSGNMMSMGWEFEAKGAYRSLWIEADRESLDRLGPIHPYSNDVLGALAAVPLKGPAVNDEISVFLLRRLPLAVGYTAKLPVTSEALAPTQMELKVTGIETIQVPAGKYNCFKVSFGAIGQTFWIGVERSRPVVKIQSGNLEAELVKMWGAERLLETALASLDSAAGWKVTHGQFSLYSLPQETAGIDLPGSGMVEVNARRVHTPPAEIAQSLRQALADRLAELKESDDQARELLTESVQERLIGGHQALSCLVEYTKSNGYTRFRYLTWVQTESTLMRFETRPIISSSLAVVRWRFEPLLEAIKIP